MNANTTTTNAAANTAAAVETAKRRPVIYTRSNSRAHAATPVALWLGQASAERAPAFIGQIGGQQVSGFIRHVAASQDKPARSFIDLVGAKDDATGHNAKIGTGNVVLSPAGVPMVSIRLNGAKETFLADVSLDMPQELLKTAGLNEALQAERRAAHAAAKAARASQEAVAA